MTKRKALTKTQKAEIQVLESTLSRAEWLEVLTFFSEDPKVAMLISHLEDPTLQDWSMGAFLRKVGLSGAKLVKMFEQSKVLEGKVESSKLLPAVMKNIAEDSLSYDVACPKCDGSGEFKESPCGKCRGEGTLRKTGDKDSRKLMLETHEVIKSGQGGQNVLVNIGAPSVVKTIEFVDSILETEVVETADGEESQP